MAFLKKAKAAIVHPNFAVGNWDNFVSRERGVVRVASGNRGISSQAGDILKEDFNPDNYLLSHATIVASVDTYSVPNVKMGRVLDESGQHITRKWSDYRITPETQGFINSNFDSWDRSVISKAYRTFVGAENYLEHVQVPELSKGKILDAVVRDIGPSLYVDILVATHKKHAELVRDILSGKMASMSMGCTVSHCMCTKCGNVATDETDMCVHIKHQKGNMFYDNQGQAHKIAEICGHPSLDPTGGVNFIEASWVGTPAFAGAALRNILKPEELSEDSRRKATLELSAPSKEVDESALLKAAAQQGTILLRAFDGDVKTSFSFDEDGDDEGEAEEGAQEDEDSLEKMEKEVEDYVLSRVKKNIRERMQNKQQGEAAYEGELATSRNDNLLKEGTRKRARALLASVIKTSTNDADLLNKIAELDEKMNLQVPVELYRTVLRVGSTAKYGSTGEYLVACKKALGRKLPTGEAKTLVRLGRILSMRD